MTALTERPGEVSRDETARLQGRLRAMTTTVIVLAVALIGLGAWMIYDFASESETAVTGEIETLLDDYTAAWNEYDSEAFLDLVSDSYTFEFASNVTPAEEQAIAIAGSEGIEGHVEKIGEPILFGDGPYYVAQANRTTSTVIDMQGISLFTIAQDGDGFVIDGHVFMGSAE